MARERRVPRRRANQPPLGKTPTRHPLKGPGSARAKSRKVRAVAAAGYDDSYDDDTEDDGHAQTGTRVPTRWVKFVVGLLLLPVGGLLSKAVFESTHVAADNGFWATGEFYFFSFGALLWGITFVGLPARWVKFVAGLLLLPVCWVLSKTVFDEFTRVAVTHRFWATEEFYFFALGALLWGITFVGLPRPLVIYVFGHELTHALWVWVQGGEVSEFSVGRDGGYIIADRRDFLVSLAPYFFPLYSIVVIVAFGAVGHYHPEIWEYRRWLFAVVGATWAFHFTFTCWMIPKQQTDLKLHGTFFSLVIIYIANVCVLTILFIVACPTITWVAFGNELVKNAADFSALLREKAGLL